MMGFFKIAGLKYEEVIQKYGTGIKQVAYSYVKDRQLAEDITQETFIRCFTKGHKFRGESTLKTWLYQIAINLCKDHLKNSYHSRTTVHNELAQNTGSRSPSAESIAIENYEADSITEYILELPIQYREIVIFYYLKGFKVREISETLQISENTVKTRLRKSRELLREGMSGHE